MPSSVVQATLALAALALTATQADARGGEPDDYETQDRLDWEREQRKEIREEVRGWTWALMPPITYEDDRMPPRDYEHDPVLPLVRVTALAATASGDAIVGGELRGPITLGGRRIARTQRPRGFIARVSRGGAFRIVQLAEKETFAVPSALAIDRVGRIVVSYESARLEVMTPDGRRVWSRDLPPARALAFADNGDILAAGCQITRKMSISQYAIGIGHYDEITDGYFARVSSWGEIRWTDRLDRGVGDLFYRPNHRNVTDCATGIAPGPGGDIYVAGDFVQAWFGRTDDREPPLPYSGSFLARVAGDGRVAWSRLVAEDSGRVALAATRDGSRVVVAGKVAMQKSPVEVLRPGLAAFDADGLPLWSIAIDKADRPEPGVSNLRVVRLGAKAGFVCIGSYNAPIEIGTMKLEEPRSGLFRLDVDARGSVKALRSAPPRRSPKSWGIAATKVSVAATDAALWIGGTMTFYTDGAWLDAVPW
jgi:hypothetical protein